MSAKDKRILITESISETHKAMCSSGALKLRRAFIATGTWMPVAHLRNDNIDTPQEDSEVKVQHFDDIERRRQNIITLSRWSKEVAYSSWIERESKILPSIKRRLLIRCGDIFLKIHEEVGRDFVLCGSWPAQAVTDLMNMINPTMEGQTSMIGYESLGLIANDVDVYVGNEGEPGVDTTVLFNSCSYKRLDGLGVDINVIECLNLSHISLLQGNDINITDVAIWVKKEDEKIIIDPVVGGSFLEGTVAEERGP